MQTATITSAVELSEKQKTTLVDALTKKFGKISVKEVIDSAIVGGVKVTVGSNQIDATIATKLQTLKESFNK